MKYLVKVSNGQYNPDFPYEGADKDIAIAVAGAYIAQGKKVFVFESEPLTQNRLKFNTADEAMLEYERDIDVFRQNRPNYEQFARWLWSVEKK